VLYLLAVAGSAAIAAIVCCTAIEYIPDGNHKSKAVVRWVARAAVVPAVQGYVQAVDDMFRFTHPAAQKSIIATERFGDGMILVGLWLAAFMGGLENSDVQWLVKILIAFTWGGGVCLLTWAVADISVEELRRWRANP
jgi:hypothetical protein